MHLFAQFEFRASIDPDEDVQQLQAGCDARAPGCRVQLNDPRSKVCLPCPCRYTRRCATMLPPGRWGTAHERHLVHSTLAALTRNR
jgi:hypothetical protein